MEGKIKSFTDLFAWPKAHTLVLLIYECTRIFPDGEMFGLTNQLRRAAVSITSNIAEGFSRASYKEKNRFYRIALSSLTEVQSQLLIARDVGYLSSEVFKKSSSISIETSKILNGLIKKTIQRKNHNS
jgi:four helix bundle protein